jgi:hypothetical protein
MILDPPKSPDSVAVPSTGRSWAAVRWSAPSEKGSIGVISSYGVTAVPHPFNGSEATMNMSVEEALKLSLVNSSCVESKCETRYEEVPGNETVANLTELVQGVEYSLTLTAFSNGSNLESKPSRVTSFTTLAHGGWSA